MILELLALVASCHGLLIKHDQHVCYGAVGCFDIGAPFASGSRPINVLPHSPDQIGTKFMLYTRRNPTSQKAESLGYGNITSNYFDATKPVKAIIHGFTDNSLKQWVQNMINQLLTRDDMNVIAVDWGKGAVFPYTQATANTRVVGAQLGMLLNSLIGTYNLSAEDFHVIGHSLGAHTAGYAGNRVPNLGRITGLDPAGPYFDGTDIRVRLDPSDAKFVDVIHSDADGLLSLGLGMMAPLGHVDFYPNGGHHQPGCDDGFWGKGTSTILAELSHGTEAAKIAVSCSHMRACAMFTESINSACPFEAFPCGGEKDFNEGRCLKCPRGHCSHLGFDADKYAGRGSLYLNTQKISPLCSYHYQVNISEKVNLDGVYHIVLHGEHGDTKNIALMGETTVVAKNKVYSHLVTTSKDIGALHSVTLYYDETSNILTQLLYPNTLDLLSISAYEGENSQFYRFCGEGHSVTTHSSVNIPVLADCS